MERRKRLSSGETRVYYSYRATVPRHVAEELGLDPEGDLVLLLAARPRWYHLLNYNEEENLGTWRSLPEWAWAEACIAGRGPRGECRGLRLRGTSGSEERVREAWPRARLYCVP
ncbi:hypothetical protein [Pyrodictium abyssi]|uniref:hypothetical protein n=1 Tax=Pyrodictium abyssi TaxID=54256 RepID=UPI0030C6C28B